MVKRLSDILLAGAALLVLWPVLLVAALAIRLSSRGPVLYRARRIGRGGADFTMLKFRTMHAAQGTHGSVITAQGDPRVFRVGSWLRRTKIDELPQLLNVLRGDMSIVGPRPEDPRIVRDHYWPEHHETLHVRPGLASPGSIFNYTHGEACLGVEDPERDYIERLMPFKLALDVIYVRNATTSYDLRVIARTIYVIVALLLGRTAFAYPPESEAAERLLASWARRPAVAHR